MKTTTYKQGYRVQGDEMILQLYWNCITTRR